MRLRALALRERDERSMDEELRLHVELESERLQAGGLSPQAARRQALRDFGGIEQIKEIARDVRGTTSVDALVRDVRQGVRRLRRDWRFTAAAVLILGLGIGATTAIFSLVNAVMFTAKAVPEPERLVEIYQNTRGGRVPGLTSYPAYLDMTAFTDVFSSIAAVTPPDGATFRDGAAGLRPAVREHTTSSYLATLGLRQSLGRWFEPADEVAGAPLVAVVGHAAWQRKFGADPAVVGRTIRLQGAPVTIVGIGPAGHNGTLPMGVITDFWLPISAIVPLGAPPRTLERAPYESLLFVKARLKPGVTVAQAQAAMDTLGQRLAAEYPKEDPGTGITVLASTEVRVHPGMDGLLTGLATLLLGVVGMVLAIAASNLATLLLVRGAVRAKEVSVRLAVGAARGELIRHLLTESLLLSLAGGVVGCVLAWWAVRWLEGLNLPVGVDVTLDVRVLGFALILSLVTGVLFGLAPALKSTKVDLLSSLRDDGKVRSAEHRWLTLKNALVVLQVAVSVLLLAGTSLTLQMLDAARAQQTGFAVDGVAMIEVDSRYAGYDSAARHTFGERLRQRVEAIPGVQAAALGAGDPMAVIGLSLVIEGADTAPVLGSNIWAGPGFFETLRIPLLYGRTFDTRDRPETPRVAVVNASFARRHFGTANALGRRFRLELDVNSWHEVIGVVGDTKTSDLGGDLVDPSPDLFFRSFAQANQSPTTVVARTSLGAASLVGAMQRELRAMDIAVPVVSARTMTQFLDESLLLGQIATWFLGALGALGLSLAGIGLYAVVAFGVARRSREIGVRMALGARSRQVVWVVGRGVAALVGVGTAIGLALALVAILALRVVSAPVSGVASIQLYRPDVDPVALVAIAAFMALVGLAAAYVPARRAARLDPLLALRHD
jgi:predicted permease